jgi:predicted nucleotidyltransferase
MKNDKQRVLQLQSELARCIALLKERYKPHKIVLFGSLAQGKVGTWSDIDLVIVKDTDKSFLDRIKEVLLLLRPLVGMDIFVYTPEEFEEVSGRDFFKKEILSKGVVYD